MPDNKVVSASAKVSSELEADASAEIRALLRLWRSVITFSFGSRVAATRLDTSDLVSMPDPMPSAVVILEVTDAIAPSFQRKERR